MKLPMNEIVKSIPGLVGIRLEEEPEHEIIIDDEAYQLRKYTAMILAQTTVAGDRDTAVDEGFRRLASYIFGENKTSAQLSMTTPVLQSRTLSMTTPVLQEQSSSDSWTISFVLPSEITLETAPTPLDQRISIVSIQPKTIATYRYSGNNTEESMHEGEEKLAGWLREKALEPIGTVKWAQYDQPFALPFLKRNEAQVEVRL